MAAPLRADALRFLARISESAVILSRPTSTQKTLVIGSTFNYSIISVNIASRNFFCSNKKLLASATSNECFVSSRRLSVFSRSRIRSSSISSRYIVYCVYISSTLLIPRTPVRTVSSLMKGDLGRKQVTMVIRSRPPCAFRAWCSMYLPCMTTAVPCRMSAEMLITL